MGAGDALLAGAAAGWGTSAVNGGAGYPLFASSTSSASSSDRMQLLIGTQQGGVTLVVYAQRSKAWI